MRNNRRKMVIFKRVASWMLVLAMLVCWIPSVASADEVTNTQSGTSVRETIYFSTSGDDSKDGLTPENAKQDIMLVPQYLAQGYNVSLKRGDTWYLPDGRWDLSNLAGTQDSPLVIGAYGDENAAKPIVAFLKAVEDSAWTLVEGTENVYVADISDMQANTNPRANVGVRVFRTFVNGNAYRIMDGKYAKDADGNQIMDGLLGGDYTKLEAEQFCESAAGRIYVKTNGGAPTNVELLPYDDTNDGRVFMTRTSYLTIQDINLKGGVTGYDRYCSFRLQAPTAYITFDSVDFTYNSAYVFDAISYSSQTNYKLEIANCLFDPMLSVAEGMYTATGAWQVQCYEGIHLNCGAEEAWIHHNTLRNMSHSFLSVENLSAIRTAYPTIPGVHNCVFEYNHCDGANAVYARAFICSGPATELVECTATYNVFRHNQFYDMTTAAHSFGDHTAIYSNIFSYTHNRKNYLGELVDGKGAQPWGINSHCYGTSYDNNYNIIVNNTFFDVGGGVELSDIYSTSGDYLVANNLIVNWTSEQPKFPGGIYDNMLKTTNYIMNNGFYSKTGQKDHIVVKDVAYTAEQANAKVPNCSGNIYADPMFATADVSIIEQLDVKQEYSLSAQSPYCYAGLSWESEIYQKFPIWEKIKDDYTDVYGNPYCVGSPSIGAVSFSDTLTGKIESVAVFEDITARTGASFYDLVLPDAVEVTTEYGTKATLAITWSDAGFDSSKPGVCTLTAQIDKGNTELDVNGKTATIKVNIKDKLEVVSVLTDVQAAGLYVLYGTPLEDVIANLIDKVSVLEEGGFKEELPITWSVKDYDPSVPGYYTFEAAISDELITNGADLEMKTEVRVLQELYRGSELLVNPDYIEGDSYDPWIPAYGSSVLEVTQDPALLPEGEPAALKVTANSRYTSSQQSVIGQVRNMGDGKYLFRFQMRAFDPEQPITTTYATFTCGGTTHRSATKTNIGAEWVQFYEIFDCTGAKDTATSTFHTSTGKAKADVGKSYLIAGCSLVYLGNTDEEVAATLDSVDLTWNTIKGTNGSEKQVVSDLTLPTTFGEKSTVVWSSSDESVIGTDGKVKQADVDREVTLIATVKYDQIETIKKFILTVPGNDQTPPVISGIENGTAYYGDATFKVEDVNIDSVTVDGTAVELTDGTYTITADNAEHTIVAMDKAGNKTEYKITVYKTYIVTFVADGKIVATVTVGYGKDATAPAVPAKTGYTGAWDKDGKNITADTTINVVYTRIPTTDGPDKTGDNSNVALMTVLMLTALSGLAVTTLCCQNNRRKARK